MVRVSDQSTRGYYLILMCLEGKETRIVMRQVADDMDHVKRQLYFCVGLVCRLKHCHRESITTGSSQMALSAGSIY